MGLWSLAQSRHPKQRNHPDASASQPSLTTSGRLAPNAAIPAGSIFGSLRHADQSGRCPIPGKDRKSPVLYQNDAIDPERKSMPSLTGQVMLGLNSMLTTSFTFAHCTEICLLEMMPL
jgi:hypothetical protein